MRAAIRQRLTLAERFKLRPLATLTMTAVWVILWGSVSPLVIVGGILFSYLITVVFPLPPIHWAGRFRPWPFLGLCCHLLADLVASSARIVVLAFERTVNLNAGIVRVDLASDNDLYQVQVAQVISLVPGTVVVEVVRQPRRLYLHAIDLTGPDPVRQIQQRVHTVETQVLTSFGSKEEIAAFRRELARIEESECSAKAKARLEHPELEDES